MSRFTPAPNSKEVVDDLVKEMDAMYPNTEATSESTPPNEPLSADDLIHQEVNSAPIEEKKFTVTQFDIESLKEQENTLSKDELNQRLDSSNQMKEEGNKFYIQALYDSALLEYSNALSICPTYCLKERSVLHGNRAACLVALDKNKEAVEECTRALEYNPTYLKILVRKAQSNEKLDELDAALEIWKSVLELDPGNKLARAAVIRLPPAIEARNERLKAEMMDKLKDLGNMVLKPFGLSTNNFSFQQDPTTGGYNVQFNQNA